MLGTRLVGGCRCLKVCVDCVSLMTERGEACPKTSFDLLHEGLSCAWKSGFESMNDRNFFLTVIRRDMCCCNDRNKGLFFVFNIYNSIANLII
jgi:hypothetical protein